MENRESAKERQWRRRLARQPRSGLTVREFCQREQVPEHQYYFWLRKLGRQKSPTPQRAKKTGRLGPAKNGSGGKRRQLGKFLPVQLASSPAQAAGPIEIVVGRPLRIAVSSGFDADLLADVIRALESRAC